MPSAERNEPQAGPVEVRPVPDPTVLTTQQLLREVAMLRELIETRLTAMDKAIELLQKTTDRMPDWVKSQVSHLQALHEEKFRSVGVQFAERDTRTEQTSRDSKVAVDAALQAAKEAVGEQNKSSALAIAKSETATAKQIDQMGALLNSAVSAINDKIEDLKERITSIESRSKGGSDVWGYILGAFGALAAIAAVVASFIRRT